MSSRLVLGDVGRSLRKYYGLRKGHRLRVSITEIIGLAAFVGVTTASYRMGQDRGLVVAIVLTTIIVYYTNRLRSKTSLLPTSLIALPMIAIGVLVIALLTGMRHPPFMVPPGWQWPPFASIQERITHAFALAIWTFVFGTPTVIVLGLIRRLFALIVPAAENANNNPMHPSSGSSGS